jgi:single-strand DNA-binding protein
MTARVRSVAAKKVEAAESAKPATELASAHRNEVTVAGRLAAAPLAKLLPSGDEIVTWRLVIDRVAGSSRGKVDAVECTAFLSRVRRQALTWTVGDVVEASGALRRRFWRGPTGLQSRYEVEVTAASRRSAISPRRAVSAAAVKRPRKPG